jgi:hypothetical protein
MKSEFLTKIKRNLKYCIMAQVAERRLHTAEGRVHSQAKSAKNSDGQIGNEKSSFASNSVIGIP